MKKLVMTEKELQGWSLMANTDLGAVVKLRDGSVFKMFRPQMLELLKIAGSDVEEKILDAKPIADSPEIIVPTAAVYDARGTFYGYTMPCARGINYNERDSKLTISERENLDKYAIIHSRVESVLRRNPNIVFPDLCTCDNIFVDGQDRIQLIDYDGLQVDSHKTISLSTSVGSVTDYVNNPKYCRENLLYTKELDKKSSIILYFLTAFNIDLNNVGVINPYTNQPITLDDIFEAIKLDDPELCHKVWKIFQDNQENDYLADTVFTIADKYDLKVLGAQQDFYIKQLSKKR